MSRCSVFNLKFGERLFVNSKLECNVKQVFVLLCTVGMLLRPTHAQEVQGQRVVLLEAKTGKYSVVASDTEFSHQGSPTFSPDEKLVAFDAHLPGESFSAMHLFVKSLEHPDEPVKNLGSGAMPSYSKDGKEMAFSLPAGGVWVMGADGHGEFQLRRDAWHIVFSPVENDVVAYGVREQDGANIVIHDVGTDETRSILPQQIASRYRQVFWNFQWSADGQYIAFKAGRTNRETVLVVASTVADKPFHREFGLLNGPSRVCFHPQTRNVYSTRKVAPVKHNRIWSLDPFEEGDPESLYRLLQTQPKTLDCQASDWSDDGERMLIVSRPLVSEPKVPAFREE